MAMSERRTVELMEEMDVRFFGTLAAFQALAAKHPEYRIEHAEDLTPVAIIVHGERYPVK